MTESPVDGSGDLFHLTDGAVAYAGHWIQDGVVPTHTHSFLEIALTISGEGTHVSLSGDQALTVGDMVLLRPGAWHGYEQCRRLDMYNCCFSSSLLQHELAWTREDPVLGHLLWNGPYSGQRKGLLTVHLDAAALAQCVAHLDALAELWHLPLSLHRGDVVGRLSLFLSCLARAVIADEGPAAMEFAAHPAVVNAMRMMEERPADRWSLGELAAALHITPRYLVRVFKAATGLPPIAYLARYRVEMAASRLLHTNDSISRIGESVGWPDQNYFARRFKAHYGLSASAYRARFTQNDVRLRRADEPPIRSIDAGRGRAAGHSNAAAVPNRRR